MRDLDLLASELARQEVLVIGADVRFDTMNESSIAQDAECGYRHAVEIAEDYGGDLSEPVTMLGFSIGGSAVLDFGLNDGRYGPDGTFDGCLSGTERPDLVIALAGPHLEFVNFVRFRADHTDTHVVLMSGAMDTTCPGTLHTEPMRQVLEEKGFDVTTVEVPGADHGGLVFHDTRDWAELPTDDPAGQATVQAILRSMSEIA